MIILVVVGLQASNVRSQRQLWWLLNYMKYELNRRLRTHSCGQDLTPSRPASQSMKKKNAERKWKALKVSGRGWGSGSSRSLIDCTLQFLTVYISIYDSSASVSSNPALKIWMRMSHGSLAGERLLQSEMIFSVWFWASCWPNNPSETNGKQIKLSPSYTVGRYYTDLETL